MPDSSPRTEYFQNTNEVCSLDDDTGVARTVPENILVPIAHEEVSTSRVSVPTSTMVQEKQNILVSKKKGRSIPYLIIQYM